MKKYTADYIQENLYVKPLPITGPVEINIDLLEKIWDHRCVIFKSINTDDLDDYRFVRYLRKGSSRVSKVTISESCAKEIIERLKLVESGSPIFVRNSTFRKVGQSEYDMVPKKRVK